MSPIELNNILALLKYDPQQPLMFNSGFFIYFFVLVILGYNFVKGNVRMRSLYLMAVSFFFYYKSSGLFVGILAFTILMDYTMARMMSRFSDNRYRKGCLVVSLVANIGMLCYFKYFNFFVGSMAELVGNEFAPFDIVLPVGISFFTFQSMSYTIDVYKRKIEALPRLIDYAFYVSFFPQLVAGPIVRAKDFIPQIGQPTVVTSQMMGRGIYLIMSGLLKKVVISDYISINFVDRIFDAPNLYSGFENLMGVYGYALQIYCDFSGYSDIAIGIALLLGFHFNINFNAPYISTSITEFWRRWHISLSGWLRDYLYISLGGNRKGTMRMYVNLLLTMLLGGLWHGASMLFIIWGGWHGVLLVFDKLRMKYIAPQPMTILERFVGKVCMMFVTFNLVCVGWVFFRSDSLKTAGEIFSQILSGINLSLFSQFSEAYPGVVFLIAVGYLTHFFPQGVDKFFVNLFSRQKTVTLAVLMALFLLLVVQVRSSEILPFIYFQF